MRRHPRAPHPASHEPLYRMIVRNRGASRGGARMTISRRRHPGQPLPRRVGRGRRDGPDRHRRPCSPESDRRGVARPGWSRTTDALSGNARERLLPAAAGYLLMGNRLERGGGNGLALDLARHLACGRATRRVRLLAQVDEPQGRADAAAVAPTLSGGKYKEEGGPGRRCPDALFRCTRREPSLASSGRRYDSRTAPATYSPLALSGRGRTKPGSASRKRGVSRSGSTSLPAEVRLVEQARL
jgi:hypothetical protein